MHFPKFSRLYGLGAIILSMAYLSTTQAAEKSPLPHNDRVQIGVPLSLFQGVPEWQRRLGVAPFLKMMKQFTGRDGDIQFITTADELARKIHDGVIDIGVFQGHEFAFSNPKYPDLLPITVADPIDPVQSFCLVRWNCDARNIGDLKDKKLVLPDLHRDHCDMFLNKQKKEFMKDGSFKLQTKAATAENAISEVIDGDCDCTVVDFIALNYYKNMYPGQFKNLKILSQSEVLPNACIVIKKAGGVDETTANRFCSALIKATDNPMGRGMLTTWKLKGFEKVPPIYHAQLKKVRDTYSPPQ